MNKSLILLIIMCIFFMSVSVETENIQTRPQERSN